MNRTLDCKCRYLFVLLVYITCVCVFFEYIIIMKASALAKPKNKIKGTKQPLPASTNFACTMA